MLKITKGLKKKKKGKKSKKNKEEELFKPEELEAYRQQHQNQLAAGESDGSAITENDEWKKFQALTAGIDNVLRKTQGDLDRIKSTSFFQRVPPASEKAAAAAAAAAEEAFQSEEKSRQLEEQATKLTANEELGVIALSDTESEEEGEEEDDIFDTSFVDAVASGEVKLAYIPESPTVEEAGGDDPFDTSIAERAILGPAYNQKGKKLVPLGAAVEVLTGRVEQPTCATRRPTSTRRKLRQNDLLLGSFDLDSNGNTTEGAASAETVSAVKSLLDDDSIPIENAPIDLTGATLYQPPVSAPISSEALKQDIVAEFDIINKIEPADDDDDEFAQLAAESLTKKLSITHVVFPAAEPQEQELDVAFNAEFEEPKFQRPEEIVSDEVDPFDTTFADNILPGKAELKLIENEILNAVLEEVNVEEKFAEIIKSTVSIHLTNPTGERESVSSLDRVDESCLNSLQPIHRDLLGGSNTDLSNIGDDPIAPNQPTIDDNFSDYSDPFDTSIIDQVSAPGQAELKFIEKEILGEVAITRTLSDPDFNPREEEPELELAKQISRPDLLEVNAVKSVAFALPTPSSQPDLLATGEQETVKQTKPLTPYYVRKDSVPELPLPEENEIEDPFDTSFVSELAPGKAELKLIENEFITPEPELKKSFSDEDFDPRAIQKEIEPPKQSPKLNLSLPLKEEPKPDLLAVNEEVSAKVLTPGVESISNIELSYSDPFDTSIACNILPGKTELKLLENELINAQPQQIKRVLTDPEFDPRNAIEGVQQTGPQVQDLLDKSEEQVTVKPLTPVDYQVSFEIGGNDDIDPFDTSVAENLVPGRTELKLLESELI